MFLKKQRVNRNGKVYEYYRIVSSYRDEAGRRKHRIEKYLGVLSADEAERVRQELRRKQSIPVPQPSVPASRGWTAAGQGEAAVRPRAFVLEEYREFVYAPRSPKEWNVTASDMLLLAREGRGEIVMGDRRYALEPGKAFYCAAGRGLFVANPHGAPLLLERIAFAALAPVPPPSDAAAGGVYARTAAPQWAEGEIALAAPARVRQLARALREAALPEAAAEAPDPLRLQLAFGQLLAAVFPAGEAAGADDALAGAADLEPAIGRIRERYRDDLTRDQLALEVGLSPEHFSRLFKRKTGSSFVDYLRLTRIRRAQELLQLSPEKSVGEIAKLTGFRSEYYFSRKFKQSTGLSPSAYRTSPKAYAALSAHATGCLLALGAAPRIGVVEPWMRRAAGRAAEPIVPLADRDEGALRQLAQAAPDLMLAGPDPEKLERLRDIGPVCPIPDSDDDWRLPFFRLAAAVGKTAEAKRWAERYERKADEARRRLAAAIGGGRTATILKIISGKLYVYGRSTSMGACTLYDALGLEPSAGVRRELIELRVPNKPIAPEELPRFAADYLFLFDYRTHWYPDKRGWMSSEAWRGLEAVKRGRVHAPDPDLFYGYDPLSLELQLETAAELLASHSD